MVSFSKIFRNWVVAILKNPNVVAIREWYDYELPKDEDYLFIVTKEFSFNNVTFSNPQNNISAIKSKHFIKGFDLQLQVQRSFCQKWGRKRWSYQCCLLRHQYGTIRIHPLYIIHRWWWLHLCQSWQADWRWIQNRKLQVDGGVIYLHLKKLFFQIQHLQLRMAFSVKKVLSSWIH